MNIYFLRPGQIKRVKIGWSSDVSNRVAELQIGCPVRLWIIGVLDCGSVELAKLAERRLHDAFRPAHTWGEWFRLGDLERLAIHRLLTEETAILDRIGGIEKLLGQSKAARHQMRVDRINRRREARSNAKAANA
jgi:hypothetical protein